MKRKKDTLLQQIAENSRDSTVFIGTGYISEHPVGFGEKDTEVFETSMHAQTGTGFFVEPDKIVTTIENLAGAVEVIAIRADRFTKIVGNRDIPFFGKRKRRQGMEAAQVSIEGVTAFDPKNNLVLLKAAETGVPLLLGDSDTALIGEKVYTLGYRGAMKYDRIIGTLQGRYKHDKWFQIETQFSPGNGGGPVLNSESEVVGVVAYGTGSAFGDDIATVATVISSNVLTEHFTIFHLRPSFKVNHETGLSSFCFYLLNFFPGSLKVMQN